MFFLPSFPINLIDISSLHVDFNLEESIVPAINGIDLAVKREKILGIVGESGCGKSVLALSIMGLIPSPGKITNGKILFKYNNTEIDLAKIDSNKKNADDAVMLDYEYFVS